MTENNHTYDLVNRNNVTGQTVKGANHTSPFNFKTLKAEIEEGCEMKYCNLCKTKLQILAQCENIVRQAIDKVEVFEIDQSSGLELPHSADQYKDELKQELGLSEDGEKHG